MRKFSRKALALSLCVVLGATGFTGCGDKKNGGGSSKGAQASTKMQKVTYQSWYGQVMVSIMKI